MFPREGPRELVSHDRGDPARSRGVHGALQSRAQSQGYRLNGRTPAQALREALGITELPSLNFGTAPSTEIATKTEVTAVKETNLDLHYPEDPSVGELLNLYTRLLNPLRTM